MERQKYDNIAGSFPPERYTQLMHWIVYDLTKGLSPIDIAVYVIIVQHRGLNKYAWVGNKAIARIIGQGERSVIESINRLKRAGYIARVGTHKSGTVFTYILKYIGEDGLPKQDAPPLVINDASSLNEPAQVKPEASKEEIEEPSEYASEEYEEQELIL